jgi:hypothetical protein
MENINHVAVSDIKSLMKFIRSMSEIFREFGPLVGMDEDVEEGLSVQGQATAEQRKREVRRGKDKGIREQGREEVTSDNQKRSLPSMSPLFKLRMRRPFCHTHVAYTVCHTHRRTG